MTEACLVIPKTSIGTIALSSTDKATTLSDSNKDIISHISFFSANVKSVSACLLYAEHFLLRIILQELSSHDVYFLGYLVFVGLNEVIRHFY